MQPDIKLTPQAAKEMRKGTGPIKVDLAFPWNILLPLGFEWYTNWVKRSLHLK